MTEMRKRKHYDDEAQMYADEEESWKKQRSLFPERAHFFPSAQHKHINSQNGEDSSIKTHLSSNGMDLDDDEQLSCANTIIVKNKSEINSNTQTLDEMLLKTQESSPLSSEERKSDKSSWTLSNLKDWRRQQQSEEMPFHARRDMVRLWNNHHPG